MWALAALFHTEALLLVHRDPPAAQASGALVVLAAVVTCWRPAVGTLLALALAEIVDVAILLPQVPNHWLLAGCVDLALVLSWTPGRRPAALLARARAPIMVSVAVFYWWTGVWKLNTDFFRPEISCAMVSWERLLTVFRWLPDTPALRRVLIACTLVAELAGPVLLLLPATRGMAVAGLVVFHLLLGLDTVKIYLNFASVMFALLILFLPDAATARLSDRAPAGARRALPRVAAATYLLVALAGLAAGPASPLYMVGRWTIWLGYALALVATTLLAVTGVARPTRVIPVGAARSPAWIVPILVALNGVAPVLGLKTRTSWQMYSNVRLEPTTSNHVVFPRSLDLLGAMTDTAVVLDGGGIALRDVAGTGLALPWIELRRRVALNPDLSFSWQRGGAHHETRRAGDDPELAAPLSLAERKLLIFRPMGAGAETRCDW